MIYVVGIDRDVLKISYNKDIKFFCQYLIDVSLQTCWCVKKTKWDYLILKITVFNPKSCLSLLFFANSHPMISASQIEFYKSLNLTPPISRLVNQKSQVSIIDDQIVIILIIDK